ncbi:unnamed protein product [marine sediment metagenome]|uniref:Uncharacterized protein n=1 Tax=marine sediment metagenome TaxID=412755 RepID=X1SG96_9ZZZZ
MVGDDVRARREPSARVCAAARTRERYKEATMLTTNQPGKFHEMK